MSNYEPPAPPPPPGGGYGAPPPAGPPGGGFGGPPPGGGYGGPPQGGPPGGGFGNQSDQWDVGSAVSYGWSKFQANTGQMIIAALAIFAGAVVILGAGFFLVFVVLSGDAECVRRDPDLGYCLEYSTGGAGFFLTMVLMALTYGLFFIYAQVVGAGMIRASLNVTNGQPFRTADVFKFDNLGPVLLTSIIVGVAVMVGMIACYVPGIIIAFLTSYSLYFVVDKNMAPVDAIKASYELVTKNFGSTIIWYLVSGVIITVGAFLCGVGLLVAIPVALVGTAYTYKKLTGQPVAP